MGELIQWWIASESGRNLFPLTPSLEVEQWVGFETLGLSCVYKGKPREFLSYGWISVMAGEQFFLTMEQSQSFLLPAFNFLSLFSEFCNFTQLCLRIHWWLPIFLWPFNLLIPFINDQKSLTGFIFWKVIESLF